MRTPAPNFTQLPNEFLDDWIHTLTAMEAKVMLIIYRKTFGWHKIRDRISITQLEKLTGHGKQAILKAVNGLIKKGAISKKVEGINGQQKTYYEVVMEENSNKSDQCDFHTRTSVIFTPTKETHTKEKKKEREPPKTAAPPAEPALCVFGSHVKLKKSDHDALVQEHGEKKIANVIEDINLYCEASKPQGYKSYLAAIKQFLKRQIKTDKPAPFEKKKPNPVMEELDGYDMKKANYLVETKFGEIVITNSKGYEVKFRPDDVKRLREWLSSRMSIIKKRTETA